MSIFTRFTLVCATLLPFCATLSAAKEGQLLVWINGEQGIEGIREVAARFTEEQGIPVEVRAVPSAPREFKQVAESEDAPDIVFGNHDRVGSWADAGLIREVQAPEAYRAGFYDLAWQAVTYRGKTWGYPLTIDSVGLIYNRELVPEPPKTLEEIAELAPKLQEEHHVEAILWDYDNPYFSWGVLAAQGAYVFGWDGADYDLSDLGVLQPGTVEGLQLLAEMVRQGLLPQTASYNVMEAKVNAGDCAMMINGPWAWENLRRSGIDFGVAPVPGTNGEAGRPFVGVQVGLISAASPNGEAAEQFLRNYLVTSQGLRTMDRDFPLVVPTIKAFAEQKAQDDAHIKGTLQNIERGQLIPNIPEMGLFWQGMGSALDYTTSGQLPASEALGIVVERLTPQIQQPALPGLVPAE
ncbi:MAG: maltose/maltodextrin ABC transporter substrate-binding protein MalE [Verrucomicrobiota bacterium JB022]|nr:maltose/maltodextrin ABC transporter substrate-binding protein MalE [Verrucomicrobiota bacterium JB022]